MRDPAFIQAEDLFSLEIDPASNPVDGGLDLDRARDRLNLFDHRTSRVFFFEDIIKKIL
jgi:hypothetical protein